MPTTKYKPYYIVRASTKPSTTNKPQEKKKQIIDIQMVLPFW